MFKIIKERFSRNKRPAKNHPEVLRYEELEQRVLFSADVVPGLDNSAVEEQVDIAAPSSTVLDEIPDQELLLLLRVENRPP